MSRDFECLPELALADVIPDVLDALVAELAVAQAVDGVVVVEALLRLCRRLDVPLDEGRVERGRDLSASTVLPVPGSPFTRSGRSSTMAALTATRRSSVAT